MHRSLLVTALASLLGVPALAGQVFSDNFESGTASPAWSGAGTVQSTQGLGAYAGLGQFHLKNDGSTATVLTLNDLAPHTQLQLQFSLAIWDSVDANPGGFPYGDRLVVRLDGGTVIDEAFGNYGVPAPVGPGTAVTTPVADLGYSGWIDSARVVNLSLAHTGPTATLSFQFPNSQGGADESFGLDNVRVSITPVPEPGTYALMALGLAAVGGWARRRRAG